MEIKINEHFAHYNFDIRFHKDARFMDQKVTPDILCTIAECIIEFIKINGNIEFTMKDIWDFQYSQETIRDVYNKPELSSESAKNEYDKFFSQPLRMLAYARVLDLKRIGNKNFFSVNRLDLLDYIATRERNALNFLCLYLKKVLEDSNLFYMFENFFNHNTKSNFSELKKNYTNFIIQYTEINGSTEVHRIFTKVLNPLAYLYQVCGTVRGNISTDIINYNELMYNRKNWRDIYKNKGETRKEFKEKCLDEQEDTNIISAICKAKRLIKRRYNGISELNNEGNATQVHHIFPQSEYPEISSLLENLILLTPNQHYTQVHPNNNTQEINKTYQGLCLLAKNITIQESVEVLKDGFYSKNDFIIVLNDGMSPTIPFSLNNSFEEIKKKIISEYNIERIS